MATEKTYMGHLDKWWRDEIRKVGECEYCGAKGTPRADGQFFVGLQAHHLILKDVNGWQSKFRHDISNGICLCSTHHSKYARDFSPHGVGDATRMFWDWVYYQRHGQFCWYMDNYDNKRPRLESYKYRYENLIFSSEEMNYGE